MNKINKQPIKYICPWDSEDLILLGDGDTLLCPECGERCSLSFSRELRKEELERQMKTGEREELY